MLKGKFIDFLWTGGKCIDSHVRCQGRRTTLLTPLTDLCELFQNINFSTCFCATNWLHRMYFYRPDTCGLIFLTLRQLDTVQL